MYTVPDLADLLGITRQALYAKLRRIKSNHPDQYKHYVIKQAGKMMITPKGFALLAGDIQSLADKQQKSKDIDHRPLKKNAPEPTKTPYNDKDQARYIEILVEQLEAKDRQINALLERLRETNILIASHAPLLQAQKKDPTGNGEGENFPSSRQKRAESNNWLNKLRQFFKKS